MAEAILKISADKAFVRVETPDAHWEAEQVSEDGLNFLWDEDEPNDPPYLVVTEEFQGPEGIKRNTVYQLVSLETTVVPNSDLEDEPEEAGEQV